MKTLIRRIKISLLGILMIMSAMVINPSLVQAESRKKVIENPNGVVELNKTATRVDGMLNEWEVDLSVEVQPTITAQDIIVIMDRSASMNRNERMVNAKKAANNFIGRLLNEEKPHDNRVALISYGWSASVDQDFITSKDVLEGKIDALTPGGGTFTQDALYQARNLMDAQGRVGAEKIIVLLSDGAPTLGYNLSEAGELFALEQPRRQMEEMTVFDFFRNMKAGHLQGYYTEGSFFMLDNDAEERYLESYFDYSLEFAGGSSAKALSINRKIRDGVDMGEYKEGPYLLTNLYKTAISEATLVKNKGYKIYSIALDLGGDEMAENSLKKIATKESHFFKVESDELEGKFKEIADTIQMPFTNMEVNDPIGDGFSLVLNPGPEVTTGTAGTVGLTATERLLTWKLTLDSFTFNDETQKYEAHVKYRIRTNMDAVQLLLNEDATGELPTNKDAVFTYMEGERNHQDHFPKPMARPTILSVEKKLIDKNGNEQELVEEMHQRQYHYEILYDSEGMQSGILEFGDNLNYHILQSIEDLKILEKDIINDNFDRFDVNYYLNENRLETDVFKLKAESGINKFEILNKLKSDYTYDGFEIEKSVADGNQNNYAELGEVLTYTITIENLEDVFIRDAQIQDTLGDIQAYLKDYTDNTLSVKRDGIVDEMELTVKDLVDGFEMMIGKKEVITITFDVHVKEKTELPDMFKNTVTVNTKKANASIETAISKYTAVKSVADENKNQLAEAGEKLTYTITVENTGKVQIKDMMIRDNLLNIVGHIKNPKTVEFMVGVTKYSLTELMTGIEVDLEPGEILVIEFEVILKDDFNAKLIKVLDNTAQVGDIEVKAKINSFVKDTGILGDIKPKPDKPQLILGEVKPIVKTPLPATGQSNVAIYAAGILVLVGMMLTLKKNDEEE